LRPIIRTADPGKTSRAFFRGCGSPLAMAPMMLELMARPIHQTSIHPQVMTNPMAVPVMRAKVRGRRLVLNQSGRCGHQW